MRKILAYLTMLSFIATPAFDDPAILTAAVNFR